MRTWAADDPKAGLMERKREVILKAALEAFLEDGYAGSSVNRIAESAGVSIKTLYRHFDNKDDLFVAVIQTACVANPGAEEPPWLDLPPLEGLTQAGGHHLPFVLSAEQLALYRVVTREAPRFPELGKRYRSDVIGNQLAQLTRYFDRWPDSLRTKIRDPLRGARTFAALLQADLVETALLGGPTPGPDELWTRAHDAAAGLLALIEADLI
ncbi:TetR/AcrR family transcriptional regulator [Streptosporangium sp. NPDC002721]|uniref:TetR/AcrR family transcriptional regulator n=1 Tax=Streptosporangium sp. NPDC002721 TaxID=3366188 RepID=UPI00367B8A21